MLCLSLGGSTHVIDIVRGGFLPYAAAPLPLNIFWTSLALLDFIAVFLLWRHRNLGIALTVGIMCTDVVVNSYAIYGLENLIHSFVPLQSQTLFLGFVLGAIPVIWRKESPNPAFQPTPAARLN